ncbi:MAG: hypothetical protein R3D63_14820 [Paracoccaceae bacterium]
MDTIASEPTVTADPSAAALDSALPEIRKAKRNGWALLIVTGAIAGLAAIMLQNLPEEGLQWGFMVLFLAGFLMFGIVSWVRKQHERAVMPIIARAFALDYEKTPARFYQSLPKNFIPQGGRQSVDDMMSGKVADRHFRFAECKTETGGKSSSVLFKGVVVELQSRGNMPDFIIASEKETKGFLFFKGRVQVDEFSRVYSATGHDGQIYGLWSTSSDAAGLAGLRAFMEQIIAIGPRVLGESSLYSLVSTGPTYYVSLRHARDLFKIGGMFADDAKVMSDIRNAAAEFGHPIKLVSEILRAEEALTAAR